MEAVVAIAAASALLSACVASPSGPRSAKPAIDVTKWTRAHLPSGVGPEGFQAVTTFGDGFAAVDFDAIWLSPDGLHWTASTLDDGCPRNVDVREMRTGAERPLPLYGKEGFEGPSSAYREITTIALGLVAVGEATRPTGVRPNELGCWSADGRTWAPIDVELPPGTNAVFMDRIVTIDDQTFGLGGKGRLGNTRDALMWTTTDGRSWSLLPDESVFGGPMEQGLIDIVPGGPGFVANGWASKGGYLGVQHLVWTSRDGTSWSRFRMRDAERDRQAFIGTIAAVADEQLVGLEYGGLWTSGDGVTWTRYPASGLVHGAGFVVRNGSEYFAAAPPGRGRAAGLMLYRSHDGLRWEPVRRLDHTWGPFVDGVFKPEFSLGAPARQVAVGSERIVFAEGGSIGRSAKYVWATVPGA